MFMRRNNRRNVTHNKKITFLFLFVVCICFTVSACTPIPPYNPFALSKDDQALNARSEREITNVRSNKALLSAIVGALQDRGFVIKSTSLALNYVVGVKKEKDAGFDKDTQTNFYADLGIMANLFSNDNMHMFTGYSFGPKFRKQKTYIMVSGQQKNKNTYLLHIVEQQEITIRSFNQDQRRWQDRTIYKTQTNTRLFQKIFDQIEQSAFLDKNKIS